MQLVSLDMAFEDGRGITNAKWKVGIDCISIRWDKTGVLVFYRMEESKKSVWFVPTHRIIDLSGEMA